MYSFSDYLVGKQHLELGLLCQDRAKNGIIGDVNFIAVADGVGSRKYSDLGADLAISACGESRFKI